VALGRRRDVDFLNERGTDDGKDHTPDAC